MFSPILNLGILAHVDAGKTSLTERLLFDNGTIAELGSVDAGSTQTDSSELERQRGITIRSAVASFTTSDLQVNLVDTPGHPDFIAEVERALSVLDGAVLVVSAVEGVQAQTRVLMRSLMKLQLPTLIFVNKVDRIGARTVSVLADIRRKLGIVVAPMTVVRHEGDARAVVAARDLGDTDVRTVLAEVLAEHDDALLNRIVEGRLPESDELGEVLRRQTAGALVHPAFFGSALTGTGCAELTAGIRTLLRPPAASEEAKPRGTVFAIERNGRGEKVAYVRLFAGRLRERERITLQRRDPGGRPTAIGGRITGLDVVGGGAPVAGSIVRMRGLPSVRVGDRIGDGRFRLDGGELATEPHFAPPSLETVVRPLEPGQETRLFAALAGLADEDPLIRTRPAGNGATSVLLYGAVQREVIEARLLRDFGVQAVFEPIQPVYFERPAGFGEWITEFDRHGPNDFVATVGLRVEPAQPGAGNSFTRRVHYGSLPAAFHRAIEDAVYRTLEQGLHGWEVTDCAVTLVRVGYSAPASVAADFRNLTPIVLLRALQAAGTHVYEPCQSVEIEVPNVALSATLVHVTALGATVAQPVDRGPSWLLSGEIPTRLVQQLRAALPGLSHGEATLWTVTGADRPVRGEPPRRARFDGNPLNHDEYMRFLADRSLATGHVSGGPGDPRSNDASRPTHR